MNDYNNMRKIKSRMKKVEEMFQAGEQALEECPITEVEILPAETELMSESESLSTELAEVADESDVKLFEMTELRNDFLLSRSNLQTLLMRCQSLMDQVPQLNLSELKGTHIEAISSLSSSITNQISLMVSTYKVLAEIENLRSPKTTTTINAGKTEIQNQAVFVGSNAELLKLLRENN